MKHILSIMKKKLYVLKASFKPVKIDITKKVNTSV